MLFSGAYDSFSNFNYFPFFSYGSPTAPSRPVHPSSPRSSADLPWSLLNREFDAWLDNDLGSFKLILIN